MLVTLAGILISVKPFAPLNALAPMLVTLDGMVTEVKLDAFWNAPMPMVSSLEPASNVTVSNFVALSNALFPMLSTFAGIL